MKTIYSIVVCLFILSNGLMAQDADQRLAYSYLYSDFEKAIVEQLDDSKLSAKEEKLYKKFMKKLNEQSVIYFENYITANLTELGYQMMPLDAVGVMGNSALNMQGYPFILFPKKTLKKNMDKDVADLFLSASLSIAKPMAAVIGLKPNITVSLKLFNPNGELLHKVNVQNKTEKKISNLGFLVNENEDFSKVDYEHAEILFSKVEHAIKKSIDEALIQLKEKI